ncbi:MAG: hypothetical protein AAFX85_17095 [Pseudomonadota bacterium]
MSLLRGAWVLMVALVFLLLLELDAWRRAVGYNEALEARAYDKAASMALPRQARVARAFSLDDEDFDAKVLAWSELMRTGDESGLLASDARFNLANLYLRRAIGIDGEADQDLLVPLVEQAKQHYRGCSG